MKTIAIVLVLIALLGLFVAGCSGSSGSNSSITANISLEEQSPEPAVSNANANFEEKDYVEIGEMT